MAERRGSPVVTASAGLVTILFTDLVGSTELGAQVGDLAADELRRDHFTSLREAVVATGGTEIKTIGDALMVSYPGAADALTGAAAMQRAVERHNRRLVDAQISMRIGISVGDATFEDGDWFGTPVVESSRLCAAAQGGQILASDLVRALAGSRTDLELRSVGDLELKGLAGPIAAVEVIWQVVDAITVVPLPAFVDTAPAFTFAGRIDQLDALITAWKEAAEGARRAVLVSGEPGIGKTRLVTEAVRAAHDRGAVVLWGRCDEEGGAPYAPFAEALRHYVAVTPPDRLRAELGPLGGELIRILPDLGARVSGLAEPMRADSDAERYRLFDSVADLLAEISVANPVVLVLDDLHWADKPSLVLLRHLLRSSTPMRLLVLATYRDTDLDRTHPLSDVLADLRRQPGVDRLDLQGLDEGEITNFLTSAAGHELDDPGLDLVRVLHTETEGNPFFVGEVLRHLAESGAIVAIDGRWTTATTIAEVGIPEGVREVVGRRLSRLSEAVNNTLRIASVIGAVFDLATVEGAGGPTGDELFDALDEATQFGLIRVVPGAAGRYTFAHALVRTALYEELTTNRRVRMHWRVGEALEARHGKNLGAHLDELAFHFGEGALAGDPAKAVEYARAAAARAMSDLAFESAAKHYERALGSLEIADDADPAERCDLLLAWAEALHLSSDERRRGAVFAAAAAAEALGDHERLARAAWILVSTSSGATAGVVDAELVGLLERALDGLGPSPTPARARLLSALAVELQWSPQIERRTALANEALDTARRASDGSALAQVLVRSWALLDGSKPWHPVFAPLVAEAESIARDGGDTAVLLDIHNFAMWMSAMVGERAEFDARFDEYDRFIDQSRQPIKHAWRVWHRAERALYDGDLASAERLTVSGMELAALADMGDDAISGVIGALFYSIRLAQGRIDELVPTIEGLVETHPGTPTWRVALAGALVESDRIEEALPHFFWLADNDFANQPRDVLFPVMVCGLGRMTYRVRPPEATTLSIYEALLPFSGCFNWTGPTVTDANDLGLAMTAATLGRHDDSDRHFAMTIDLCTRARAQAMLARGHFDWGRVLADRGDQAAAREHLELAMRIGEPLGMTGPLGVVERGQALLATFGS
jgi:class 3 adenylate cyclase/tetratricopeptide (TPR) repeat protein